MSARATLAAEPAGPARDLHDQLADATDLPEIRAVILDASRWLSGDGAYDLTPEEEDEVVAALQHARRRERLYLIVYSAPSAV